ncbi:hypothetical protein Chor_015105 [Crotalus horridus]
MLLFVIIDDPVPSTSKLEKVREAMDETIFRSDTVLSDIHLHTANRRHFMVRLNAVGQPVFLSQFRLLLDDNQEDPEKEDGGPKASLGCQSRSEEELIAEGRAGAEDSPDSPEKEEHTMATPLEDVGKQVWRGAFLLADYILSKQDLFKGCTVLELGAGIGFVSIIMAKAAKTIYCTGSEIRVKKLDWQQDDFCTVFYDDDLTDAFFKTLSRIASNLRNDCTIFFSTEKRFNFTLRQMDVVCEAYNHFRSTLDELLKTSEGRMKYSIQPIELSFPQHIVYERVPQLELWKLSAQKIPDGSRPQPPGD